MRETNMVRPTSSHVRHPVGPNPKPTPRRIVLQVEVAERRSIGTGQSCAELAQKRRHGALFVVRLARCDILDRKRAAPDGTSPAAR